MPNKIYPSFAQAVADIPDGSAIMFGGMGAQMETVVSFNVLRDHGPRDRGVGVRTCRPGMGYALIVRHDGHLDIIP